MSLKMTMATIPVVIVFWVVMCSCGARQQPDLPVLRANPPVYAEPTEAAVFAAVVKAQFEWMGGCHRALLDPRPIGVELPVPELEVGEGFGVERKIRRIPLPADLVNSFRDENESATLHSALLWSDPQFTTVDDSAIMKEFFPEPCTEAEQEQLKCGWAALYKRYPKTCGIWRFSHVGFDTTRSRALAYYDVQYDWLGSEAGLMLLRWTRGKWTLVAKRIDMIS